MMSVHDRAKIPDTLFYDNALHTSILNNLARDFALGEHLLLIGNQGTGKNKLVDRFLHLSSRPREYIQLHRDTTVHSLTLQPVIESGVVRYEDSPLVKAVKSGRVLVVDEADKAPLHVTCVLKSLIESGEMLLSDGRKIVSESYVLAEKENAECLVRMHPAFRMIILANRFSFPFLGNDFFTILGDLLACHPVDNPDPKSEIEMLKRCGKKIKNFVLFKKFKVLINKILF
jgi:MoxR-like ATPase